MNKFRIPVLCLIGPVGIGKTTAAESISYILRSFQVRHAIIDLDYVRRSYPNQITDSLKTTLAFKNFAALWRNYIADGARQLIVPSAIEWESELDGIRKAVPGASLSVIRLDAPLETNLSRIRNREIHPTAVEGNIKLATEMHRQLPGRSIEDAVINTQDKSPDEIAREAIELWKLLTFVREPNVHPVS